MHYDIFAIAAALTDTTEQYEEDNDLDVVHNSFYEKYGIYVDDIEIFTRDLLKLTPVIETALTKTEVHAFIKDNQIISSIYAS